MFSRRCAPPTRCRGSAGCSATAAAAAPGRRGASAQRRTTSATPEPRNGGVTPPGATAAARNRPPRARTGLNGLVRSRPCSSDFAVEETWVPWLAGAALVPKPRGGDLLGPELAGFLREQRVTALCCVPTLLATLDDDLPGLRGPGRPYRGELPDRDQGDAPVGRPGARRRGPARLAFLRDPPLRAARQAVRRAQRRTGTVPPHRREDQAQPRDRRAAPAGALRAAVLPARRRAAARHVPGLGGVGAPQG